MTPGFDLDLYDRLLVEYHPQVITDDEDLARSQAALDDLLALADRTPEQDALLDLVTALVEDWERDHVEVPSLPPRDVIRFLLASRDLPQRTLIPVFGTESIVSEVLAGRRELQTKHITGLAEFFSCSPAAFFGPAGPAASPGRRVVAHAAG